MKNKLIKTIFVFVFMFIGVCNVKAEEVECIHKFEEVSTSILKVKYTVSSGKFKITSYEIDNSDEGGVLIKKVTEHKSGAYYSKGSNNECPVLYYILTGSDIKLYNNVDYPEVKISNGEKSENKVEKENGEGNTTEIYCSYRFGEHTLGVKYNKKTVNYYYAKTVLYNITSIDTKFSGEAKIKNNFSSLSLDYSSGSTCPIIYYNYSSDSIEICNENNNDTVCHATSRISGKEIDASKFEEIGQKDEDDEEEEDGGELNCTYELESYSESYTLKIIYDIIDGEFSIKKSIYNGLTPIQWHIGYIAKTAGRTDICPSLQTAYQNEEIGFHICTNDLPYYESCGLLGSLKQIEGTKVDKEDIDESWEGADFSPIGTGDPISCEEMLGEKGVSLLKGAFLLIKIAAPLLFVLLSMIDFMGGITSDNPESARNKAFSNMKIRAIACALLYNLPLLIKVAFDLLGVIELDNCGVW